MKVIGLYCVLLAIYFGQKECESAEAIPLSACHLEPTRLYKCAKPTDEEDEEDEEDKDIGTNYFDGDINYKFDESTSSFTVGQHKVLDVKMRFDTPITSEFTLAVKVSMYSSPYWEVLYDVEKQWCEHITEYLRRAWKLFRNALEPPIEEECYIDAGEYNMANFTLSASDLDIPWSLNGRFKVDMKLLSPEKKEFLCQTLEVDVRRKSSY